MSDEEWAFCAPHKTYARAVFRKALWTPLESNFLAASRVISTAFRFGAIPPSATVVQAARGVL